jgi:hypothetical protein
LPDICFETSQRWYIPPVQQADYLLTNRGRLIGILDGSPGTLTTKEGDRACVVRVRVEEKVFDRNGKLRNVNKKFTVAFLQPLADWVFQNAKEEANVTVMVRFEMYAPDRHRAELRLVGEGIVIKTETRKPAPPSWTSARTQPVLKEEPPDYGM